MDREFRLALLQATRNLQEQRRGLRRREVRTTVAATGEQPPFYNTGRLNRADGPEDRSVMERCMAAVLPDFAGYRRIVQAPGTVSIFYDVGQGQGWQRVITLDQVPHLPQSVRQRFGDSRGHWEGNTLVVDVTNFSPKSDFMGARENLHLVERWTRARRKDARVHRDDRGSDDLDEAVDRQAGNEQAGRAGEPDLLRAAMPRRELRPAGVAVGHAR